MLGVFAFAGYSDQPVAKQALTFLAETYGLHTATLDESARPVESIAVFVVSTGRFPSNFLRKLPEEPERRRTDIERRGFIIPEGALGARHVFVLKASPCGGAYGNGLLARFHEAVAGACGLVKRTRRSRRANFAARQEQKKRERQQDRRLEIEEGGQRASLA